MVGFKADVPVALVLALFLENFLSAFDDDVQDAVNFARHHKNEKHHADVLEVVAHPDVVFPTQV